MGVTHTYLPQFIIVSKNFMLLQQSIGYISPWKQGLMRNVVTRKASSKFQRMFHSLDVWHKSNKVTAKVSEVRKLLFLYTIII